MRPRENALFEVTLVSDPTHVQGHILRPLESPPIDVNPGLLLAFPAVYDTQGRGVNDSSLTP